MSRVITDNDIAKFDMLRQLLECGELPPSYPNFLKALGAHIGSISARGLSKGNASTAQQPPEAESKSKESNEQFHRSNHQGTHRCSSRGVCMTTDVVNLVTGHPRMIHVPATPQSDPDAIGRSHRIGDNDACDSPAIRGSRSR